MREPAGRGAKKHRLILVAAAAALAAGALLLVRAHEPEQYYRLIHEAVAGRTKYLGKRLLVLGCVTRIEARPGTDDVRLFLHNARNWPAATLEVRLRGSLPPNVRTGGLVVVGGRLEADGTFTASGDVFYTKCPAKYDGRPDERDC